MFQSYLDRFAAQAMTGILAANETRAWQPQLVAQRAYEVAHAMIAERNRLMEDKLPEETK